MSPRNHFFQVSYPKAAQMQRDDHNELSLFVWHAFTKYTGIQKLFSFTVLPPKIAEESFKDKIK
jgi:hypothetical protein